MKIGLKYLLVFCLCYFFFSSCKKKYEEGPLISFQSKCNRLQEGQWQLEYLYIDNIDSTNEVYKSLGSIDNEMYIDFIMQEKGRNACLKGGEVLTRVKTSLSNGYFSDYAGYYNWGKDKKYLEMLLVDNRIINLNKKPVGPLFTGHFINYRIKKLTKKDLWLDVTYNGKYVWMHFKR
jgi:hypothetical protein